MTDNNSKPVASRRERLARINIVVTTAVLAAAYAGAGYVGFLMAVPPGNVTLLWPPSGMALAAILLLGFRAVPGVFLGAVIVNGQAFLDTSSVQTFLPTLLAALSIGLGSVLQPLTGRALLDRFSKRDDPFGERDTILRTGCVLAVASLVSSGIGSLTLWAAGLAPNDAVQTVFGTWWLGDLIGMLTFTPLVLAVVQQSRWTALLLVLAAAIGFGGTFAASTQVRRHATLIWDQNTTREVERLTSTLLLWLENSVAPVNSIATLFETSDQMFEEQFIDAATRVEGYQPDFFPSSLAIVAAVPGRNDLDEWEVLYSINETGPLAVGANLSKSGFAVSAIRAALNEPGRLVIGDLSSTDGTDSVAIAAIGIERADMKQVALGVIDIDQLVGGLFAIQVPDGIKVRISGYPSGASEEALGHLYGPQVRDSATIETKTIRGAAAQANFTFAWDATEAFLPGTRTDLAGAVLVGGVIGSTVLILFLTFILGQNEQIRRRVRERTAELAERQAELRLALDNMPGGICMLDKDLRIQLVNDLYCRLYDRTAEDYAIGRSIVDVTRANVLAGLHDKAEHFDEDVDRAVENRLSMLRSGKPGQSERTLPNGRILHVAHNPVDGGGVVLISTDVTERVKSEETARLLREAMEVFSDSIVLYDKDEQVVFTNDRYHELYPNSPSKNEIAGFTQEQLLRRSLESGLIDVPLARSDPETWLAQRLEERRSNHYATGETLHASGRTLFYRHRPTMDGGLIIAHTDISERKEAERRIELERGRLVDAIQSFDAAFAMYDAEGRLIIFNDVYKAVFREVSDLMQPGVAVADLVRAYCERTGEHEKSGRSIDEWVKFRVQRQREHKVGVLVHRNDRWFLMNDFPTSDGGTVTLLYDVSDLKNAERELADKEAQLTAALETMTGGLFMIDSGYRLRVFNDRLAELYDLPRSMLQVGAPLSDIIDLRARRGDYGAGDPDEMVRQRIAGYRLNEAGTVIDAVGDRIIEVHRAPASDGGMVCVFNDITERKTAEEALSKAHSLITESLAYASRIQRSLLPSQTALNELFLDHSMVWRPKDIVGGDMIWLRPTEGGTYLIVADCTGHGAPGAFMTMICTGAIDQAVDELPEPDPAGLIERMNRTIKAALGQDGESGESDDGVELGICFIDDNRRDLVFAGARFSLHIVRDGTAEEIKGDKSAIGYRRVPSDRNFTNRTVDGVDGARFYLWSDGVIDQIGGPKRRSFGKRRLRRIIQDNAHLPVAAQEEAIMRELADYQGAESQRDDMTIIGFALA